MRACTSSQKTKQRPPGFDSLQQQYLFDALVGESTRNGHLRRSTCSPCRTLRTSPRQYDRSPELTYPFHDRDVFVTAWGRLYLHRKRINISSVPADQRFGIKGIDHGIWRASFMHYDVDTSTWRRNPCNRQPVGTSCHPCLRYVTLPMSPGRTHRSAGGEGGIRTPDRLAPMPHFECGAFDHSATSPGAISGDSSTRGRGEF